MNESRFNLFLDETIRAFVSLLRTKGKEYSQTNLALKGLNKPRVPPDRLANFRELADKAGVEPSFILYVHMNKHMRAVENYCLLGRCESDESIISRIHDNINYLILLKAFIVEKSELAARANEDPLQAVDPIGKIDLT